MRRRFFACVGLSTLHCRHYFVTAPSFQQRSSNTRISEFSTPSFGTVPHPASSTSSPQDQLGNVKIQPVQNVTSALLHGPWVCIMPQGIPSGELMFLPCGTVFFRPGTDLGQGAGTFNVTSSGVFNMTLEAYCYSQTTQSPPNEVVTLRINAVVQQAVIGSHNAVILTMQGKCNGQDFQAAKMDGWTPETQTPKPWAPDAHISTELNKVIPPLPVFAPRKKLDLSKYKVGDLKNIYYVPNWISSEEETAMLKVCKGTPDVAKSKLSKRLVQEWGCTMCSVCNTSFVAEGNMPTWCTQVCDGLLQNGIFQVPTFPNNVRIHEYDVGEGIAPHVDGPIYVPIVAIVSMANSCLMSFYKRREPYKNPMDHYDDTFKFDGEIAREVPACSIVLEPRSLLIFTHDVYWYHPHGISDKTVDSLKEEHCGPLINRHLLTSVSKEATELARHYRVGVTVRNLLPRCNHLPTHAEYFMKRAIEMLKSPEVNGTCESAALLTKSRPPSSTPALPQIRKAAPAMPAKKLPETPSHPPRQPEMPAKKLPVTPVHPPHQPEMPFTQVSHESMHQQQPVMVPMVPWIPPPGTPYANMSLPPTQFSPEIERRLTEIDKKVDALTKNFASFQDEVRGVMQALLQSHIRHKEDQGQIMDQLSKVITDVDNNLRVLVEDNLHQNLSEKQK